MHSFFDTLLCVLFILYMGFILTISITTLAQLFVQDFIDRHERQHHRRSEEKPKTTDGK